MPQLDTVFQTFVTWQTVLFCLGISLVTHVIRTVVETTWKGARSNDIWNEVGVRLGPIGTGAILALSSKTFPWPTVIASSKLGLVFYGGACGVASAYVYGAFRAWLTVAAKSGFEPAKKMMPKKFPKPGVPINDRPTVPPKEPQG